MKYTFETEQIKYLSPEKGVVEMPNKSNIEYRFTNYNSIVLTVDGCYLTTKDIKDLKELLTAFQTQLSKQS